MTHGIAMAMPGLAMKRPKNVDCFFPACFLTTLMGVLCCAAVCRARIPLRSLVVEHPPPIRLHLAEGSLRAPCLVQRVPFQGGW